jgi:hypothetical protein
MLDGRIGLACFSKYNNTMLYFVVEMFRPYYQFPSMYLSLK